LASFFGDQKTQVLQVPVLLLFMDCDIGLTLSRRFFDLCCMVAPFAAAKHARMAYSANSKSSSRLSLLTAEPPKDF